MITTDKRRIFEILVVVLTGAGKFVFMNWLNWRLGFIITVCLFWLTYVWYRYRTDKQILAYWGLTKKHFKSTFKELFPYALGCIAIFIVLGTITGKNIIDWSIIPILLLYPIWGILQQFIMLGLVSRNLKDLQSINVPTNGIVFLTSIVFAIVHYPFLLLIIGTFFLALVYTTLYLNNRNLIVLGIFHGWLAAFFFYAVLGRNSWQEAFGGLGF